MHIYAYTYEYYLNQVGIFESNYYSVLVIGKQVYSHQTN